MAWLATPRGKSFSSARNAAWKRAWCPPPAFPLETIRSVGLKGMGPVRLARNLLQVAPALSDSAAILRRHRVAAAFGVGGYAAGPVMLLAAMSGLPTVLFEPNAAAGFSNRLLAMFVTRMATGYPSVAESWGARAMFTGCPVRPEFFDCPPSELKPPYRVLITGGSQGARVINRAVVGALETLKTLPLSLVHQTGERDYNEVRSAYESHGVQAEVAPFFTNMAERFVQADLLVCRAGANAVAEIAAAGRAALFIPFGAATDNHQLRNAEEMMRSRGRAADSGTGTFRRAPGAGRMRLCFASRNSLRNWAVARGSWRVRTRPATSRI